MKISLFKIIFFSLLLFFYVFPFNVTNDFLKNTQREIVQGIDLLQKGDYKSPLVIFKAVQEKMPGHPVGYFLYSASLHRMMVDYRNFSFEEEFFASIDQAITLSKKLIKKNKEDPWGHFYLGASYGFRGIFHSEYGGFVQAFIDGKRGYEKMKTVLSLDETIYDAYYGVGMYQYWRGVYAGVFYWLFGSKNEQYMGIERTKLASEKGFYSKVQASSALIRVYYNEQQYELALQQAYKVTKTHPNYLYCYWYIAKCYEELNKLEEVLKTYNWLKNYFEKTEGIGPVAIVEVNYHLGKTHKKLGNLEEAEKYLTAVIETPISFDERILNLKKYDKLAMALLKEMRKK